MGILPFRKSVPLTTREILINNRKRLLNNETPFAIKEAYIKLRTSLMFCMTQDGGSVCRVFAVTSPNPSEGKSLTAANIAISFAMLGRRTLLIDADMRKPTQRLLWNVRTTSGLCDYLAAIRPLETARVEDLPLSLILYFLLKPSLLKPDLHRHHSAKPVGAACFRPDEALCVRMLPGLCLYFHRYAPHKHGRGCTDRLGFRGRRDPGCQIGRNRRG